MCCIYTHSSSLYPSNREVKLRPANLYAKHLVHVVSGRYSTKTTILGESIGLETLANWEKFLKGHCFTRIITLLFVEYGIIVI